MGSSTVPPTRVGLEGSTGPFSGDVLLRLGVALQGDTPEDRVLQVDADPAELPDPYGLFIPGALTAREIARIRNRSLSGTGRLRSIEANLGILAGTGTTAANHYRIRIAGATSGSVDLPISVQNQRRFLLEAAQVANVASSSSPDALTSPASGAQWGGKFRPSAQLNVSGAAFHYRFLDPQSPTAPGIGKRLRILSADRQTEVATTGTFFESWPGPPGGVFSKSFESAVVLEQGVDYWLTVEVDGGLTVQIQAMSTGRVLSSLVAPTTPHLIVAGVGTPIEGPIGGGAGVGPSDLSAGSPQGLALYLTGSGQAVNIAGDIIVSTVLQGSAPGTPGGDVNLSFLFA